MRPQCAKFPKNSTINQRKFPKKQRMGDLRFEKGPWDPVLVVGMATDGGISPGMLLRLRRRPEKGDLERKGGKDMGSVMVVWMWSPTVSSPTHSFLKS